MEWLLDYISKAHEDGSLDRQHTIEGLFYLTQLLRHETRPEKIARYEHIRARLQERLDEFRGRR